MESLQGPAQLTEQDLGVVWDSVCEVLGSGCILQLLGPTLFSEAQNLPGLWARECEGMQACWPEVCWHMHRCTSMYTYHAHTTHAYVSIHAHMLIYHLCT